MACRTARISRNAIMLILITPVLTGNIISILCPKFVTIEKGKGCTVQCNATDELSSMYWYRGSPLTTSPILRMDNGKPGGLYYKTRHYDISSTGAMIIRNATIDQEAVYTFVAFFQDGSHRDTIVTLHVIVVPYPPCPQVSSCNLCGHCNLNVSGRHYGHLQCSVTDSRPQIKIRWIIETQQGLAFNLHQPTFIHDYKTDSWTSIANVSYEAYLCGDEAVLQCLAEDNHGLLSHSFTEVRLFADDCMDDTSVRGITFGLTFLAAALVLLLLVGVVIYSKTKESTLISCLKTCYGLECTLKLLPWLEPIPLDSVFTDCYCEITYNDDHQINISAVQLLTDTEIKNQERILILGDRGCGKTAFAKRMVQQWVRGKEEKFTIIIFISLKGVKIDMKLVDIVMDKISKEKRIKYQDVENALKEQECLILLDGLQDISFERFGQDYFPQSDSLNDSPTSAGDSAEALTIQRLLQDKEYKHYKSISVWVTALDTDELEYVNPHWSCTIKLNGFSEDQLKVYIRKVCTCFSYSNDNETYQTVKSSVNNQEVMVRTSDRRVTGDKKLIMEKEKGREVVAATELRFEVLPLLGKEAQSQTEITSTQAEKENNKITGEKCCDLVYEFLRNNNIFSRFGKNPYLVFLMINIKSAKLTSQIPQLRNVTINSIATLIHCVTICMETKVGFESQEQLDKFNALIGKVAFHNVFEGKPFKFESTSFTKDVSESIQTALGIGLVKKVKLRDSVAGMRKYDITFPPDCGATFCHNSIRDYFAAYNISKNPNSLKTLTEKLRTHDPAGELQHGVLRFSWLFQRSLFEELCKALQDFKLYNCIIDCLHDRVNHEEVISVVRQVSRDHIVISHTNEHHHNEAVKTFFQACSTTHLKSISFAGVWSLSYLEALEMPELENLELRKMSLNESGLISCLKWVLKKKFTRSLRFTDCKIPFILSSETEDQIKSLHGLHLQVRRKNVIGKNEVKEEKLNFETGKWEW